MTKRYYFDQAFLAVLPGRLGLHVHLGRRREPDASADSKKTKDYTVLQLNLGGPAVQRQDRELHARASTSRTRAARRRATSAIGDSLVSFPVWAFATDDTAGSSVNGRLPGRLPGRGRGRRRSRRPTTDATGRTIFRTRPPRQAADVLRLPRRRPPGRVHEPDRQPDRRSASRSPLTIRAWPDDAAWAKRVGGARRARPAGPRRRDRPALAARRRRSSSRRRSAARPAATPGSSTRRRGRVEIAYYADDFVVLHEAAHGWFNGALLADRWANEAFASYYAPRGGRRPQGQGDRRRADAGARGGPDPAQRLGPGRARGRRRPRTTPTRPAWRSRGRSRSGPAPTACRRSGPTRRPGRRVPAGRPAAPRRRRVGRRRRTGAACSTCSRSGPASRYDDLWRTWVARTRTCRCSTPAAAARTRYDAVVARGRRLAAAAADPRRDARLAVRRRDARCSTTRARSSTQRDRRSRPPPRAAGLTAAGRAADGVRGRRRVRRRDAEADAELAAIDRYERGRRGAPDRRRPVPDARAVGRRPRGRPRRGARRASRAGDLAGSAAPPARPRPPGPAPRSRPGPGRSASACSRSAAPARPGRSCVWCAAGTAVGCTGCTRTDQTSVSRDSTGAARPAAGRAPYATLAATSEPARAGRDRPTTRAREEPTPTDGPAARSRRRTRSCPATRPTSTSRAPRRILEREGLDPLVTMEVFARQDAVLCGIDEAKNLLGHVLAAADPEETRLEALDDGDVIEPKEVVLRIRARYRQFGLYETAFLGMLAQSTGWATAARECVDAAAPRPGHQLRGPPHPPGHHRRPRLRGDRRRLRRRVDAGRRPAGRSRPDRHDAPLAGPDLRRHRRGGPRVRPRTSGRTCRGSSSSTRSRTRPRRRCGSPTPSATGCILSRNDEANADAAERSGLPFGWADDPGRGEW